MIDKLILTTPRSELTKEIACQLLQGHYTHSSITASKFHHEVVVFHKHKERGGHLLTLHLKPRFSNTSDVKIELNPSSYQNFNSMREVLEKVVNTQELKITRVDHCADIQGHTVDSVNSRLILSRKKSRELYKNGVDLETLYLGQPPERLVIYNKSLQEGSIGQIKTRIELQQHREKVSTKAFISLADYQSYCPFEKLKFQVVTLDAANPHSKRKSEELMCFFLSRGAQATFKAFNKHSNFKRDYGRLLVPDLEFPNLDHIYQQNLKSFFREETV